MLVTTPTHTHLVSQAHGSDLLTAFAPGDMTDYFIHFVNHLNPNGRNGIEPLWPRYSTTARLTLQFNDGSVPINVTRDEQRLEGTNELFNLSLRFPI